MPPQFSFGSLPAGVKNVQREVHDEGAASSGQIVTPRNKLVGLVNSTSSAGSSLLSSSSSSKRQKLSSWSSTYNRLLGGVESADSGPDLLSSASARKDRGVSSLRTMPVISSDDDERMEDDSFVAWEDLSSSPLRSGSGATSNSHSELRRQMDRSVSSPHFIRSSRLKQDAVTTPIARKEKTRDNKQVDSRRKDESSGNSLRPVVPTSTPVNMDPAKELMERYRTNSPTSPIATYPFQTDVGSAQKRSRLLRRIDSDVLPLGSARLNSMTGDALITNDNNESMNKGLRADLMRAKNPQHIQQLYSPGYLKRSLSVKGPGSLKKDPSPQLAESESNKSDDLRANLFPVTTEQKNVVQLISLADDLSRESSPFVSEPVANVNSRQQLESAIEIETIGPMLFSDDSDDIDLAEIETLKHQRIPQHKSAGSEKQSLDTTLQSDDDDDIDFAELERLEAVTRTKQPLPLVESREETRPVQINLPHNHNLLYPVASKPREPPTIFKDILLDSSDTEDTAEIETLIKHKPAVKKETTGYDFKNEKLVRSRQSDESQPQSLKITILKPTLHRYLITHVSRAGLEAAKYSDRHTILTATTDDGTFVSIVLKGCWCDSPVEPNDIVHIVGEYNKSCSKIVVDDDRNLLILRPDILVSCTNVADSLSCKRKVVLRDRIRTPADSSRYFIMGNITHELFQICLAANDFSTSFITEQMNLLVFDKYLEELTLVNMKAEEALSELNEVVPKLKEWARVYLRPTPSDSSTVETHRGGTGAKSTRLSVSKVIEIEEEIWSPMFGLKGKIDATVEATVKQELSIGKFLVPLELKTSKSSKSVSHRAQTTLYMLLLSDRYNIEVSCGVLYYSSMSEMIRIPSIWDEVKNLIFARNELVRYMDKSAELPPVIRDEIQCRNCAKNDVCMVYHKASESGTQESSGVNFFDSYTEHLTPHQMDFFNKWDGLLYKEHSDMNHYLKEIWTMTSSGREKVGRCYGKMVISELAEERKNRRNGGLEYTYILERYNKGEDGPIPLNDLANGEMIVVSDESGHVCLARGTLRYANSKHVKIAVDRRLTSSMKTMPGFDAVKNQVFYSMLAGTEYGEKSTSAQRQQPIFRIDRDEFGLGMSMLRNNILQLFVEKGDHRRRSLVVDLEPPQFEATVPAGCNLESMNLNPDQKNAVEKVIKAKDYALILGMPGTGKTTTIAAIVKMLVDQGKTVLIASHTHSAVDNILLKLRNKGFDMLRLGGVTKVHPDIVPYVVGQGKRATSEQEIEEYYLKPPVVGITCLGINNWLCSKRRFDYCIVDEASQITLPSCLGPIRLADKFVLVGDHYQLSPLVRNVEAQEGGLDISLFKYLCENHPHAMVNLEHQYRMCSDIMVLSNKLIYDGRLKCGSDEVKNQKLTIPNKHGIDSWRKSSEVQNNWLDRVLDEK
ncbi:bifunctional ATP-dependent DNA helicase/ssDNA endodeoxyribonuclease DNA2 [Sugiyamaella lignohabitans]|uniref:DNA replication ATP-dependent helicase/nuclease n=1 Tax=Sugiyamaella lignohabitans TaxID=796027 RepID=A0A167CWN1_9ASCO|nr:bifunctional ATP-dependent DNA helicase/ssDNA endodeoxyribonuclease DNA2 [Sugiyamaella lignohabitans]ANB12193.1 bifunctional ATP-dependent DNA helicase/ssDNA endodeoxyribonuclease DNA2 [Sugiyamaella lignohabitans]